MAANQETVFVSGCNGFVATRITVDLLKAGYKVIGSVRSQDEIDQFIPHFKPTDALTLVIVEDISVLGSFDEVFKQYGKEIKYVLHTASPFIIDTTEYVKDLLIPAVNGTQAILEAIKKYAADSVERVVITSSFAAQAGPKQWYDNSLTITEESWNPSTWDDCQVDGMTAYCASKVFAEKEAWKFLKDNESQVKFKITTINPGFVYGPQTFFDPKKKIMNTSSQIINHIVHSKKETDINEIFGPFVDVRDISKGHILAFQKKELIGKRLSMVSGMFSSQGVLDIVNEDFPQLKGKIPVGKPGTDATLIAKHCTVINDETKKLLGFEFIDLKQCIDDTVKQILEYETI